MRPRFAWPFGESIQRALDGAMKVAAMKVIMALLASSSSHSVVRSLRSLAMVGHRHDRFRRSPCGAADGADDPRCSE